MLIGSVLAGDQPAQGRTVQTTSPRPALPDRVAASAVVLPSVPASTANPISVTPVATVEAVGVLPGSSVASGAAAPVDAYALRRLTPYPASQWTPISTLALAEAYADPRSELRQRVAAAIGTQRLQLIDAAAFKTDDRDREILAFYRANVPGSRWMRYVDYGNDRLVAYLYIADPTLVLLVLPVDHIDMGEYGPGFDGVGLLLVRRS